MQERIKHWWTNSALPFIKALPGKLKLFFTTPFVLKNLGLMLVAILTFFLVITKGLDIYTQHGKSLYLDNLQRMPLDQAKKIARKGDYKVVVFDSIWKIDLKPGVVIAQNPSPGASIKEGRTVYLTISSATPPKVEIPPFKDAAYMYESYKRMLEVRGIQSSIKEEIIDSKQAKGSIVYMTHNGVKITEEALKEGFLLEKGETLEFVITKQIIQQRTVPELICLKLATARFMLESSQLNFDAYEDASVIDLEEAFIYKQTPDPGTSVKSGDYVKLFLTLEQPLACDEDDELPEIDPLEDN